MSWVWHDGRLLDEAEVRISPFDHGLTTGDGAFETLRVYRGVPFAMRRHLARLARSAAGLGLAAPDSERSRAAMLEVVRANSLTEGRLRVTLTGGESPLGSARGSHAPTLIVAASPLAPWPATERVARVPWPRNERGALSGLKTTSYGENVVALAYARERDAGEAIFDNTRGELCEGTGSNVFVVRDGELSTPPTSSGCLAGITRELLIELVDVRERELPGSALARAEEAFLTSSTREVHPIAVVDGKALPAAPGPHTQAAQRAFAELIQRDLDP